MFTSEKILRTVSNMQLKNDLFNHYQITCFTKQYNNLIKKYGLVSLTKTLSICLLRSLLSLLASPSALIMSVKSFLNADIWRDFQINYKEGGTLISMHHSYLDYLEDNNLIEPPRV